MSDDDLVSARKRSVGGEMIIPVAGIVFSLYYFSTILEAPWTAQVNAFFLGSVLIFLSLLLIAIRMRALMRGAVVFSFRELIQPVEILGKRSMLLGIGIVYVLIVDWAGFTISTFLLLLSGMLALGARGVVRLTLIAAAISFGGWLLFIFAFGTRLPYGPFEYLMRGLI